MKNFVKIIRWASAGVVTLVILFQAPASAAEIRPFARVEPLPLGSVEWTSGFWAERFESCRTNMIPGLGRLMEGTNYSQFFRNFEIAAGIKTGRYRGAPFNDGDFYKLLEAAAATFAVTHDDFYDRNLDRVINVIAKAQRSDGYLHTQVIVAQRNGDTNAAPFKDRNNFEMYNMGHLLTAACVHHQATRKTNLLAVAIKAADFLCAAFSNASPEVARSSVCPSHYMGMVDLYRETGERRYLNLARKFFELRSEVADGGDDNQDRVPFEKQTSATGHAVRANYLYAGAADLYMETGASNYWRPLDPIWKNITEQKMYITGGCGALYDGASPDGSKDQKSITRVHQAYGRNYQLPNTTAHNETCANIGNAIWNWRMFLATGEARFMDVVELELYNAVLSGASMDGTNFFYTNPLRVTDPMPLDLRWSRTRVPFVSSFCCPPNLARTIAESAQYAYSISADAVWVNLYGGSKLEASIPKVGNVSLIQESEYPWTGKVRIRVESAPKDEFTLRLRIPNWARGSTVGLNRQPPEAAFAGSYFELKRVWRQGDTVDLDMPMPVRLIEANPLVEETIDQVALQRGPIVYCLESTDIPKGVKISDVYLPEDISLRARHDERLLGGVVVLEGKVSIRRTEKWGSQLYRDVQPKSYSTNSVQFIPYYAWQNRGASEMTVWLPRAD